MAHSSALHASDRVVLLSHTTHRLLHADVEEAIKSGGRTSPYKGRSKAMFYDGPKSAVYKPADCVIL